MSGLKRAVAALALFALCATLSIAGAEDSAITLTVLYDNVSLRSDLRTDWGYACLIEGLERTILFDTGANGEILMSNIDRLGKDPAAVDVIVLTHFHGDHTFGLEAFLERNSDVTVYMPESFPAAFQAEAASAGAEVLTVSGPVELSPGVYSSGELGEQIIEQALILETSAGLVVITGCAHPGILDIVRAAKSHLGQDVELITGGFHLGEMSQAQLQRTLTGLRDEGVRRVAPSHCTGDVAVSRFRAMWGEDFVTSGCGAVIELAR